MACLLLAAFFDRIKKVTVGGVEIELDPASLGLIASLATQRVQGDLQKVGPLVTGTVAAIRSGAVYPQGGAGLNTTEAAEATLANAVETTATQLGY